MSALACQWMGVALSSPVLMGSINLLSHMEAGAHQNFFSKAMRRGAGGVVLPPINPERQGNERKSPSLLQSVRIDAGLEADSAAATAPMGLSVLRPEEYGGVSPQYGVFLAKELKTRYPAFPIFGSVAKVGRNAAFFSVLQELAATGVDGIELDFSRLEAGKEEGGIWQEHIAILENARNFCSLPLSVKLSLDVNYGELLAFLDKSRVDSLSVSGSHTGLLPPKIARGNARSYSSPFDKTEYWAPTKLHGPQERCRAFYNVYRYGEIARAKQLHVACTDALFTGEEAIQALLLGAHCVQLSSAVAWRGLGIFREINREIEQYCLDKGYFSVEEFMGAALASVKNFAREFVFTRKRFMSVDESKCKRCEQCSCTDRLCLAFKTDKLTGIATIVRELCSGCDWCRVCCPHHAVIAHDAVW